MAWPTIKKPIFQHKLTTQETWCKYREKNIQYLVKLVGTPLATFLLSRPQIQTHCRSSLKTSVVPWISHHQRRWIGLCICAICAWAQKVQWLQSPLRLKCYILWHSSKSPFSRWVQESGKDYFLARHCQQSVINFQINNPWTTTKLTKFRSTFPFSGC